VIRRKTGRKTGDLRTKWSKYRTSRLTAKKKVNKRRTVVWAESFKLDALVQIGGGGGNPILPGSRRRYRRNPMQSFVGHSGSEKKLGGKGGPCKNDETQA